MNMNPAITRVSLQETPLTPDCVYSIRTIDAFLWGVKNSLYCTNWIHEKRKRGKGTIEYVQAACAFDIETTSVLIDGRKVAFMYCWQFGINGFVIMGRYWEELRYLFSRVRNALGLGERRKLICGVHNFAYEFQFMRKWFSWVDVFALRSLTPLSAELPDYGIMFRCTYLLTGCSLRVLADKIGDADIKKRCGDLDYTVIHTPETPLTDDEKMYCIMDVFIIMVYLARCIVDENGVENIPRTKTGYVRRRCRDGVLYHPEIADKDARKRAMFAYHREISALTLAPEEYKLVRDAFAGGFTHASCLYAGTTLRDITSYDFSSSYPACAVLDYFPTGKGLRRENVTRAEFEKLCKLYCTVASVTFYNLRPKISYEFYISKSKCRNMAYEEYTVRGKTKRRLLGQFDNGRVVSCPRCTVSITEIDFDIINRVYEYDDFEVGLCYTYPRGRLHSDLIKIVADLYNAKNTLKDVKGAEKEYMLKKEDLNSIYGMMVTDLIRTMFPYTDDWEEPQEPDLQEKIAEYNKNFARFTFYPQGVYITAHARRRLWSGILACGADYVYSDTDSIKILNVADHMDYINRYNAAVLRDLQKAAAYHNIPLEMFTPKTKKGAVKVLGAWDFDGHYTRFKTLGAKRYLRQTDDGDLEMTVTGVNPKKGAAYMSAKYGDKAFKYFDDELVIPAEHTGKLIHSYIDEEIEGDIVDYTGKLGHYHELSYIHLSPAEYSLSIADDFINFLRQMDGELFYEN